MSVCRYLFQYYCINTLNVGHFAFMQSLGKLGTAVFFLSLKHGSSPTYLTTLCNLRVSPFVIAKVKEAAPTILFNVLWCTDGLSSILLYGSGIPVYKIPSLLSSERIHLYHLVGGPHTTLSQCQGDNG